MLHDTKGGWRGGGGREGSVGDSATGQQGHNRLKPVQASWAAEEGEASGRGERASRLPSAPVPLAVQIALSCLIGGAVGQRDRSGDRARRTLSFSFLSADGERGGITGDGETWW